MSTFSPLVLAPILYSPPVWGMQNAEPILYSDWQPKCKKVVRD